MMTRAEYLSRCKSRATAILESGDAAGAVASMISDLGKWKEPLYDKMTFTMLTMDGLMFCKTPDQVRHWIDGFN
jgi:hypothetical protein